MKVTTCEMVTQMGMDIRFPLPWDGVETPFDRHFREKREAISQADGYADTYKSGCPILPESDD